MKNHIPALSSKSPQIETLLVLGNGDSRTLMSLTFLWLLETNSSSGEEGQRNSHEIKRQIMEVK
jgi:hypothetical protein